MPILTELVGIALSPDSVFISLMFLSGFLFIVLGYFPWKSWGKPAAVSFSLMCLITGVFVLFLSYSVVSFETEILLLSYLPIYVLPIPWSVFVLKYTGVINIDMFSPKAVLLLLPAVVGAVLNIYLWNVSTATDAVYLFSLIRLVAVVSLLYVIGLEVVTIVTVLRMSYKYEYMDGSLGSLLVIGGAGPWLVLTFGAMMNYSERIVFGIWGPGFLVCFLSLSAVLYKYPVFDAIPAASEIGPERVIEQLNEPIVVLDSNERIARLNPEAQHLFNKSAEEVAGEPVESLIGVGPDAVRKYESLELEVVDGTREFECTVTSITDDVGRILGHTLFLHDITERESRKERIRELNEVKNELEQKNEKLDDFAATISHDLRNPLSVARGNLEIEMEKRDHNSEYLENAEQAHERMSTLIDDLLTLARQGETVDEVSTVDLEQAVKTAWGNVDTKDAKLETSEKMKRIEADWGKLVQILENLIRNSIEHAGEDVTIEVGMLDPAKDLMTGFYFEDDGPGIPEEERDKVFEHGFSTRNDGTGLGLSIVKEIVNAHGWNITATESDDGGARFEIMNVSVMD